MLTVILAVLVLVGTAVLVGLWEHSRRRRVEDLAELTAHRTAEEIIRRVRR